MFYPVCIAYFSLLSSIVIRSVVLGANGALSLSHFEILFVYFRRILLGDTVYPPRLIYFWSMIILLWKSSSYSLCLSSRLEGSDWASPLIPLWLGACSWRSLDRIFHPEISWEWVVLSTWFGLMNFGRLVASLYVGNKY